MVRLRRGEAADRGAGGLAADPVTGGYWIAKSDGGVDTFAAPWYGSMAGQVPAGQSVTGIAGE